jgi:hypothetical protein
MNAFFSHRIKRITARVMLLVWLFALSAGAANACLLELKGPHGHAATGGAQSADHPVVSAEHRVALAAAVGHEDQSASKAPCLKVCDETPQSPVNQGYNPALDGPGLAAALWSPWSALILLDNADARGVDVAQMPPTDRPLRVKYSRLAL